MYEEKPLVLALTETWLHNHREAEMHMVNYKVFRKDRHVRKKGRKEKELKSGWADMWEELHSM